ncbi:MAG: YHS domain-containing (seleno)protein [Hyphomicrobiales bacterium]
MKLKRGAKLTSPRGIPLLAGLALLALLFSAGDPSKALTDDRFWHDPTTGLAIAGYDPVSYFAEARPRPGLEEFEYVWQGSAFRFSSTGNLAAFMRDPEVYAPRLGGYGLVAVARGNLAAGNPNLWAIFQGRLYLFHTRANQLRFAGASTVLRDRAEAQWRHLSP